MNDGKLIEENIQDVLDLYRAERGIVNEFVPPFPDFQAVADAAHKKALEWAKFQFAGGFVSSRHDIQLRTFKEAYHRLESELGEE